MTRRDLLALSAAGLLPSSSHGAETAFLDRYFLAILEGYLKNLARTSSSLAVCDFAAGTIKPGSCAPSGKTYDSVTRMLPAIAAYVASGREPSTFDVGGKRMSLTDLLATTFRNAFDPENPDYWGASPEKQQQQRQVESSIVAWSLWLSADRVMPKLTTRDRANAQAWLASCTRVPVRSNNWAWFTAVNIAARLALSEKWKEFSADDKFMLDDLAVLDKMAIPGEDGWFTDSAKSEIYDYYNLWVFASHFLYWNKMVGSRYPEWQARFGKRLRQFLTTFPCFFGANGSHILFGRSLIYRWGVLTPLPLAYDQKLWPHSPGLLRRIMRMNIEYLWNIGGFDAANGKLLESLTPAGSREICESYIDNGHPYWGMQAFAAYMIPKSDPFWSAPEEKLPVEKASFVQRFEGPKFLVSGERRTGEVRWMHSVNGHSEPDYRDKYTKFSYSSHFPYSILKSATDAVWDNTLVFRDAATGTIVARSAMTKGTLLADGVTREWTARLGKRVITVKSEIRIRGEFEYRRHTVEGAEGLEAIEGSYALGLAGQTDAVRETLPGGIAARSAMSKQLVSLKGITGWQSAEVALQQKVNVVHARTAVATLRANITAPSVTLESIHYSSNSPIEIEDIRKAKWL